MIIKGGSRAGPSQLARHLRRADTNERVEVLQLDSPTESLAEALRDWQFLATGTRGSKGLYHANIDPDARYKMTPEQWQRCADVLGKELGLEGQPRVVVLHEKNGREHIHVVWQRTDVETMTLKSDGHNYHSHERASMALEREFGHEHVPGKHAKRDREKQPELPKATINHAEWQQGERTGIDPRALKEAITAFYEQADQGRTFKTALEEKGYVLATGDRRDYVIVDEQGQIYSLARQIKGVTARDLRAFMADVDRESIPTVEQAKAMQREKTRQEEPPGLEAALKARHEEEGKRLRTNQEAEYKRTGEILKEEIAEKMKDFDALQRAARERDEREHPAKSRGVAGFVAAIKAKIKPKQAAEEKRQRQEAKAEFLRRQENEREKKVSGLRAEKESDLAELAERHAQQRRGHAARLDEDRARHARDQKEAERLRAEIEERRKREEELRAERERAREGPDPPKRAR